MKKPKIISATDLHLTEKPEDQYRFGIFGWMLKNYADTSVENVIIPGDLTDRKNHHSDWFVNKVVDNIRELAKQFNVLILVGNHDYSTDRDDPFFRFLNAMDNVTYFQKPTLYEGNIGPIMMLPHSRNPEEEWKGLKFDNAKAIFLHQTFSGAKSESGIELEGLDWRTFFRKTKAKIFSGDIHVPQQVGPVTYIGCPYHIHYGDKFKPRCMLMDENFNTEDVFFPALRKHAVTVHNPEELRSMKALRKGDRVKVRVQLPRSEFSSWREHRDNVKKICKELGLELKGPELKELQERTRLKSDKGGAQIKIRTRDDVLNAYCKLNDVDEFIASIGRELLAS